MFKIFEELKRSNPARRQDILMRMHDKNIEFLRGFNPELADFVKMRGTGVFGIRVTDTGVEVFDRVTQQLFHPPGGLLQYMAELGGWHHTGWVDKLSILHVFRGQLEHTRMMRQFLGKLYARFPELAAKMAAGVVQLPKLADGRRFSGPVVFLGIFTGLHIAAYMNRTVVRDAFLIEPDLDRFALSTFFLDYALMEKRFGRLLLHVGENAPQYPIDALTSRSPVTAATWVRMLPAYPAGQFDDIINRMGLRWRALSEIFVPYDREMLNLCNGMKNVLDKRPFLLDPPELSAESVVVVVASGPSLNADMAWLKENQKRLVIMASISCVRVLKENGIEPDFQCTLDTEMDDALFEQLRLDPKIPLVAYYKISPTIAARFETVLLLHEDYKANIARFKVEFSHTHPTTGNLTVAFAMWCKPATLLLLGLDLGYRDPRRSHVEGGWHDENEGVGHDAETGGRDHLAVAANFPESEGDILTMSYYNSARFNIEDALKKKSDQMHIWNLADGAKVEGAEPMHSIDMNLPDYPAKRDDVEKIKTGFGTDYDRLYEVYDTPGQVLLDEMVEDIVTALKLPEDKFSWVECVQAFDSAWDAAIQGSVNRHRELRIEMFGKLIHDLLAEWYRTMLLDADSTQGGAEIYRVGLEAFEEILKTLRWPDELDVLIEPNSN